MKIEHPPYPVETSAGLCLYSYAEAARYLGPSITPRWVKRQVLDFRTIPAIRLSGRTLIEKTALDAYIESRREEVPHGAA